MSSSPSYVQYVLEQLSELEDIRCRAMMGEYLIPYAGAKPMLLVPHLDSRSFVAGLLEVMYPDIPLPKPKKKKT